MKPPGLKGWRERRGMSQRDLALAAGVTQQSVSKFERGAKGSSEPAARRLAEALGVGVAELRRAPEAGKSEPRVSRLSLHRAYLKRILAGEVGSAYAAMPEGELEGHCRGLPWEGLLGVVSSRRREVRLLEEELERGDLHPEVRRFYEKVVRQVPDQYFRLLSAARTWERSRRGWEELATAVREVLQRRGGCPPRPALYGSMGTVLVGSGQGLTRRRPPRCPTSPAARRLPAP